MFVITSEYRKPVEFIDQYLEEHRKFLDQYIGKGVILVAGRKVPRTGGVIIARAESKEAMEKIMGEDPFSLHGIAVYEVTEFAPTKVAKGCELLG